ncbi:hypothetical protein OAE23_00665 [Synechococcus sp. AH-551-E11]|nr:hypothetical protein [Synechococcus sp. AH-551-E11]
MAPFIEKEEGGNGDQSDVERVVHTHASCLPPKVFDGASSAELSGSLLRMICPIQEKGNAAGCPRGGQRPIKQH